MGLGKTIQELAPSEKRRGKKAEGTGKKAAGADGVGPSLVVVPRSLVFNWKQEATKFTPGLRVLDHSGVNRERSSTDHLRDYDLVLTTYGTLRRDAALFRDFEFDYAIL